MSLKVTQDLEAHKKSKLVEMLMSAWGRWSHNVIVCKGIFDTASSFQDRILTASQFLAVNVASVKQNYKYTELLWKYTYCFSDS